MIGRKIIIMRLIELLSLIIILAQYGHALLSFPLSVPEFINFENSYKCACNWFINEYYPVCGSDELTYYNAQHLQCKQKCENPRMYIVHNGLCKVHFTTKFGSSDINRYQKESKLKEQCNCLSVTKDEYNPVCGNNGITYENPLALECDKQCKLPNLKIARYGLCREDEYFSEEYIRYLSNPLE